MIMTCLCASSNRYRRFKRNFIHQELLLRHIKIIVNEWKRLGSFPSIPATSAKQSFSWQQQTYTKIKFIPNNTLLLIT